ncbi:MFS transporter [Adhaeribacter aquaticus]|uniref:MFS transporter n=1 Tax=Adhaeribacter aquaticus TaxID=299567 RepID=UPI00047DAEB5|nr:MFS transporter [Adhaeribacter aquaticus]
MYRIAVGSLFFLLGLCFASWASRIPTIQHNLKLNESQLGAILFSIPIGSLVSLPLAGWLVAKLGSRKVVTLAILIYGVMLVGIGAAQSVLHLTIALFFFGFVGNLTNISINTQAIGVEALYKKSIMASFHGLWSLAGFMGAGLGAYMIGKGIIPVQHFSLVLVLVVVAALISTWFLLPEDTNKNKNQPIFVKPDKSLINLGIIAFCCMICEGAMFDWSGVYFKKVVLAKQAWVAAGYTAFMCTMALSRFFADSFTQKFGFKATIQVSGILTACGLMIAVLFPDLITALIGFLLVGAGVSSVVPLVYGEAGKSNRMSPSVALAAVSTIGFLGFLVGPPLIGLVAGATSLRVSFTIIAFMGLCITFMASKSST